MANDNVDEGGGIPLRDAPESAEWERVEEQVKDEILYRKVIKPTGVAHAYDILKYM